MFCSIDKKISKKAILSEKQAPPDFEMLYQCKINLTFLNKEQVF